jgi:flagellar protein FlaE/flagellar protein FlaC
MGLLNLITGDQEEDDSTEEEEDFFGEGGEGFEGEEFGDEEGDEWGDGIEEGDESITELEERVEQVEAEVKDISSAVSTIKKENDEVNEQLNDIEENIRSLLEIYEMVTRGVNPFVDEDSSMVGEGFDIFGTTEQADETAPRSGQVAGAEAEEFFEGDDFDEWDIEEDETGREEGNEEDVTEKKETGDTTFDDLKEQYEQGETGSEGTRQQEPSETSPDTKTVSAEGTVSNEEQKDEIERIYDDERVKLESLPRGYASDALIMEWINFLIQGSDVEDAVKSVNYYAEIEWMSEEVRDKLKAFMLGHPEVEKEDTEIESASPSSVDMDHHLEGLRYVSRLEGGTDGREVVEHMD